MNNKYSVSTNETTSNINQIKTFKIFAKPFKYSKIDL